MDTDFPAHIGDRTGRLHHHPGSLFPELRREFLVFPMHLIPSLPVKTLHRAPCPEGSGQASVSCSCDCWVRWSCGTVTVTCWPSASHRNGPCWPCWRCARIRWCPGLTSSTGCGVSGYLVRLTT